MDNWKQQVIALLQGLIVNIEQLDVAEGSITALVDTENTIKDVEEILNKEIEKNS